MKCPNCNFNVPAVASFCPSCGYRFDNISQNGLIRIVISPPPKTPSDMPSSVAAPAVLVERSAKSSLDGIVIFLTVLVTLLFLGATAIGSYIIWQNRLMRETAVADSSVNANSLNATATAVKPLPETYEDLKNKIAPPDKSRQIIDEEFSIAGAAHRAVPFSISNQRGAVIAGGFRVTKGKTINFYVYPADVYLQYPTNGIKPIQFEQTRNKILNEPLKAGGYYLVFESSNNQPAIVAAEILLVDK